jgi:pyrroline-5-carboxylate reductase
MSVTLPSMAIIGTGKMGGAILDGVLQPGVATQSLRVTTQSDQSAQLLRGKGLTAASLDLEPEANVWAVAGAKIVIIAVKPARVLEAIESVAHVLEKDAVVVSVAAGITTEAMEKVTSNPVVRAMPNTPTQIGQGVTGLAAGSRVTDEQVTQVEKVFGLLGHVVVVPEEQINALSAISGSGPAYVFYIAEKLIDAATSHGFTTEQAHLMVQGTLLGAAALLEQSGDSPAALRAAVTSPGGTTEQAIAQFDESNLGQVFSDAINRAIARAEEMGRN